nr:phage/plasmid primase, P4 family [Neoroseomonas marina]
MSSAPGLAPAPRSVEHAVRARIQHTADLAGATAPLERRTSQQRTTPPSTGESYLSRFGDTLVRNGYAVIPIMPGTKHPPVWMSHKNGDPWSAVKPDPRRVKTWIDDKRLTDAGVGINLGRGLFAIDIDVIDEGMAAETLDWCLWNLPGNPPQRTGLAPKTLLLFRTETPIKKITSAEFVDGQGRKAQIEGLGEGEQFVAYAVHPDTKRPYVWPGADPVEVQAANLPLITVAQAKALIEWFEARCKELGWEVKRRGSSSLTTAGDDDDWTANLDRGKANLSLDDLKKLLDAIPNDGVNGTAGFDDWLNVGMALFHETDGSDDGLRLWCEWSGLSSKHVQAECERRWPSFDVSHKDRRPLTARWLIKQARGERLAHAPENEDAPTPVPGEVQLAEHTAEGLIGQIVHIDGLGFLRREDGETSFKPVPRAFVLQRLTQKLKQLFSEALQEARNSDGSEATQKRCAALAGMLQRQSRIRGAADALAALPTIATTADRFDRDPDLAATPTGVQILPMNCARPAEPGDRFLRCTAVSPQTDPLRLERDAPHFAALLEFIAAGDRTIIAFLQTWFGYCMTGHAREHRALVLVGPGGNGKGSLLNIIQKILGSYGTVASSATFLGSASERHSEDVDALRGFRFVTVQEVPPGSKWSQQRLTSLISTDPITARGLYQARTNFIPTFVFTFAMNTRPRLARVDAAIRRRLLILETDRVPSKPDPELPEKMWREAPAILRWMLDGAARWYAEGLSIPHAIKEASENYFEAEDVVPRFLAEVCEAGPGFTVTNDALKRNFADWLVREGRREDASAIDLPLALSAQGFERIKDTGGIRGRGFRGLRIRPDDDL